MKIEKLGDKAKPFELDVKRFYCNYVINDKCPECKTLWKYDLTNDYLSYPTTNKPIKLDGYCQECYAEWVVGFVKLTITLEETMENNDVDNG